MNYDYKEGEIKKVQTKSWGKKTYIIVEIYDIYIYESDIIFTAWCCFVRASAIYLSFLSSTHFSLLVLFCVV